jgi:hypothetical protein
LNQTGIAGESTFARELGIAVTAGSLAGATATGRRVTHPQRVFRCNDAAGAAATVGVVAAVDVHGAAVAGAAIVAELSVAVAAGALAVASARGREGSGGHRQDKRKEQTQGDPVRFAGNQTPGFSQTPVNGSKQFSKELQFRFAHIGLQVVDCRADPAAELPAGSGFYTPLFDKPALRGAWVDEIFLLVSYARIRFAWDMQTIPTIVR